jgi:hypothetical protein
LAIYCSKATNTAVGNANTANKWGNSIGSLNTIIFVYTNKF